MGNADRIRKKVQFTLSDKARQALEEMAQAKGLNMSELVERLILTEWRKT